MSKFSFMKIFDSSLSFSPAEAQAKFYSITKTVVQNSGLHNTSWYVFKLANPDEIVTWNDPKVFDMTWKKNDERQYNITEGVSLKRNLTILVKGFKQCLAIHYCGVFGGTHEFFNCDSLIAVQIVGIKFAWKWNALSKNKNLHLAQWYTCTHLNTFEIIFIFLSTFWL